MGSKPKADRNRIERVRIKLKRADPKYLAAERDRNRARMRRLRKDPAYRRRRREMDKRAPWYIRQRMRPRLRATRAATSADAYP
jgi:hypothetical protein